MRNHDFDNHFAKTERAARRGFIAVALLGLVWITFLIGAGSTLIWLLGRWLGAW